MDNPVKTRDLMFAVCIVLTHSAINAGNYLSVLIWGTLAIWVLFKK